MIAPPLRNPRSIIGGQKSIAGQVPAPIAGMNATASLANMGPLDCVYTFNALAVDDGLVVRPGCIEWANGWGGGTAKTIIPFEGNTDTDDKLFVANNLGIWDVTTAGEDEPTQVVTFASQAGNAGYCSYVSFANDAGARFLLVCDGENGYYVWTQSSNTWELMAEGTDPGEIDGVDPELFDFVMTWKNRVWFIQRNSGTAWYLPIQQFAGTVTKFEFSTQFASGGYLKALYNWTLDGGAGIDDYLVAISSSGDTLIYQGTDPDEANAFGLRGMWNIGRPPEGNRIGKEFGGELYLLSIRGIVKASHLLQGQIDRPEAYLSNKVSPLFRRAVSDSFDSAGWHLHAHPATSRLYTNTPLLNSGNYWGFSYYFGTGSWSMVRGLPKFYTENWQDRVYWVDAERNKIFYEGGNIDFVYLDPEVDGDPALIESVGLTAFSTLQNPGVNKRLQFIRPVFLSDRPANYRVEARYNYDLGEILQTPEVPSVVGPGIWNTGIWNTNFWASDPSSSQQTRGGGTGMGTTVAIGYKFLSSGPTTLVSFDLAFDTGGFL